MIRNRLKERFQMSYGCFSFTELHFITHNDMHALRQDTGLDKRVTYIQFNYILFKEKIFLYLH